MSKGEAKTSSIFFTLMFLGLVVTVFIYLFIFVMADCTIVNNTLVETHVTACCMLSAEMDSCWI